jgi:hypothetical protein
MSEQPLDPRLARVAAALSGLAPSPGRLDRDRLFFEAGQAKARGRQRFWQGTSATSALVAAGLAVILMFRPVPTVERVVFVPAPPEARPAVLAYEPDAPPNGQRQLALQVAADALAGPAVIARHAPSVDLGADVPTKLGLIGSKTFN